MAYKIGLENFVSTWLQNVSGVIAPSVHVNFGLRIQVLVYYMCI